MDDLRGFGIVRGRCGPRVHGPNEEEEEACERQAAEAGDGVVRERFLDEHAVSARRLLLEVGVAVCVDGRGAQQAPPGLEVVVPPCESRDRGGGGSGFPL